MSLAHVVAYANFLTKVLKVEIWCRGTADDMRLQRELLPVSKETHIDLRMLVFFHSTEPVPQSITEQLAEDVRTNRRLWIAIHCRGALLPDAGAGSCPL